jgi:iron complex outermembrane recepter protein
MPMPCPMVARFPRLAVWMAVAAAMARSQAQAHNPTPTAQSTAASDQLQEIVVTAQFRRENLQQTPIAITAVNAAMLEQRNQTDISQVAAQAPNVTLQPNGAAFGSSMVAFIRGVGQTDFDLALEPGVGIYVDDVYYATLTGSLLDLLDLDRVEILRGPQGTLAGKNSIGGAIKLFTQKPTGEGGFLEAGYGSLHRVDARGAGDFTLISDKLFARVSFASKHHDGYVTRVDYGCTHPGSGIPQMQQGDRCILGHDGDQAFDAVRIALRWLASDSIEVNLTADATNDKSGVQANVVTKYNPNSLGAATYIKAPTGGPLIVKGAPATYGAQYLPYGPYSQDPNHPNDPYLSYATYFSNAGSLVPGFGDDPYGPVSVPPINHYNDYGFSNSIKWTIAQDLSLTSITAYRYYDNQFAEQTDASPVGVQILLQRQTHSQLSEELRLSGSFEKVLDYTFGGFFMNQFGGLNARVGLPWVAFDFIHGPDSVYAPTRAGFFNGEWHATDNLTVDAGVRYSHEEKTYIYYRHNGDGTDIQPAPAYNNLVFGLNGRSATFSGNKTDYRVALDYQITPDVMAYVQTATGYKGGGVNPRPFYPSQTLTFNPETLTAYEVGLKTNLFDRRMRLNLAAFYNNYKDIQLTLASCPTPPLNGIQYPPAPCALPANVGTAHVKGVELETEIHPVAGLEFDASASWLDFKYTQINGGPTTGVTLAMVTPYTPKYKASAGAQYEFRLADAGTLVPRLDVSYQSSQFTNPINDPVWNQIDGYTVLNGKITWTDKSGNWQTSLAVTNLTDKLYYLTLFDLHTSTGYVNAQPAMPREWLVSVKRSF